jgi:uncharacterized protein DUF4193
MAPKTPGPSRLPTPPDAPLTPQKSDCAQSRNVYAPAAVHHGKATMADDLDEVAVPDDLDDDALELDEVEADELDEEALEVDLEDELDSDADDDLDDAEDLDTEIVVASPERVAEESDDEEEEEPDDEDVEASLDVILKERMVVEDEPEDDEVADVEDRTELTERVLPKQPDEFVCRSCFLVKHPSQLADKKRMLCRDCV